MTLESIRVMQKGISPAGKFEFLDCDKAIAHIRDVENIGTTELSEFIKKPIHITRKVIKILESEKLITSRIKSIGRGKKLIISPVKGKL